MTTEASHAGRPERLLIVDDERELADALAQHLSAGGRYAVETAYSGEEALAKLSADPPDKLLLDIALPGITGWEVCRQVRELPSARPVAVVLMTAWLQNQMAVRAGELGVTQMLLKPFENNELERALDLAAARPEPAD